MRWSVSVIAEGDREVSHEEVIALADAVAGHGGIASGIGSMHYGAQVVVEALDRADALRLGTGIVEGAARAAGLPAWPITTVEALSEDDDLA
jgi:hypothetical protein